jgi:mRNA-degrading endonuclease RelE of RelBE toxin-antitoxin system
MRALEEMGQDPFAGDVVRLTNQPTAFRRRVGDWRIFFDADTVARLVEVTAIERRTTTTYRKR